MIINFKWKNCIIRNKILRIVLIRQINQNQENVDFYNLEIKNLKFYNQDLGRHFNSEIISISKQYNENVKATNREIYNLTKLDHE